MDLVIHDIVFGKFINRLLTEYKDQKLTDAQLCTLYRECDTFEDIAEILNTGASENLP